MLDLNALIRQSLEKASPHSKKVYGQNPLSGPELVELANARVLNLAATVKPNQTPHLSPVDVNIVSDRIYIGIDEGTARQKNLTYNPHITIMIADGSKRQAIIEGETRMIETKSDTAANVFDAQKRKYGWTTQLVAEVLPSKIFTYKAPKKE